MTTWPLVLAAETSLRLGDTHPWGTALGWSMTITTVVAALILACIIVSLIAYRGRQTEGSALWLHLIALGILPLVLVVVGNFATVEYAKEVRFCGSCHLVMRAYIDEMRAPEGTSLAALHFQHRVTPGAECYACHANYGIHGAFEAKLVGFRHVYKYWTGTYLMPVRLPEPFDNVLCLKCHEGAKRFVAEPIHLEEDGRTLEDFLTGVMDCTQCHEPAHELAESAQAARHAEGS